MSKAKQEAVAAQEAFEARERERRWYIEVTARALLSGLMHGRELQDVATNIGAYVEAAVDGATVLWQRLQEGQPAVSVEPPIFTDEVVEGE